MDIEREACIDIVMTKVAIFCVLTDNYAYNWLGTTHALQQVSMS